MKKTVLLLTMVGAAILMAGCSYINGNEAQEQDPKKRQASSEQEKTVVVKEETVAVNEGMSKKEEKEIQQRLAELEEKIDDKSKQKTENEDASQPEQDVQGIEEQASEAAQDYYAAAAAGNYDYTYDALSSASQSQLTQEEWVSANTALGSDAGIYRIDATNVVDDSTVVVYLTITSADGSSFERTAQFVSENGVWKHDLTSEEYQMFAGATDSTSATASASSGDNATVSASASASASATGDTKHVKIVVTSNKPADVSINDDSLNWYITEEVVGTETYEKDIAADSGLSVSATTDAYHAQSTIEVYEDGELVAQDSDPHGFATVNY